MLVWELRGNATAAIFDRSDGSLMSETCSRAAVVLIGMSWDRSSSGLNSMSIKHSLTR